ncbi:hypothetical protein IL306_006737 [Fusarium sp. DS 682]|nr:hypothetical protein IL306_006737 [Fusarium sp. DS 682]
MAAINDCYFQCSASFGRLIEALDTPTRDIAGLIPRRGIQNEHARFNVWAGSVGAKHSPHKRISLDRRLRESNFYLVRVIDILQRLDSTLCTKPQSSEELTATGYLAQLPFQNKEPEQTLQSPLAVAECMEYSAKDTLGYAPTISKGSLLTSTEATKFVPPVDMKEEPDVQSEFGTISTFGFTGTDRETLRLPLRPQDDNGEALEQFLCPLCYHLIEVKGERAWTRHVFRDLQAYVCTFDNCEAPDALFETRQDWIQHEFENHRREWYCNDPKHNSCGSEKEFVDHMRALHKLRLPESQLLSLAKLCERPSSADTVICSLCRDGYHDIEDGFERFKPSSIVRQGSDQNYPKSLDNETADIANLPEGNFNEDKDTLMKVTPWVASLPNAYETEGNSASYSSEEPQQVHPTIAQRGPSFIPSSDLKRHVGQHLERLALFAINRSKLIPDDGMSAHTEDAVARSESSFDSLQSLDSLDSDENYGNDQAEDTAPAEFDSTLGEIARFEHRYRLADRFPVKLGEIRRLIKETLVKSEFDDERSQSGYLTSQLSFFSPEGTVESIITVEVVLWAFCNQGETPSKIHSEPLKSRVIYTLGRGKKLFCISVLCGFEGKRLQQAMHLFRKNEIWDEKLPLQESVLRNLSKSLHEPVDRDHTELGDFNSSWGKELETLWNAESIDNFFNYHQWKFCAPVTTKPVYVTVKRLYFGPLLQRELVELRRIQALNQRHIVNLITTFRRGEEDFFLVCEGADGGNLEDFWETFPRLLTAGLVKSVIEQLYGLAYACSEVDMTITDGLAINGNLKPENILWFKDESGVRGKIGTLKTCHQSPVTELVSREAMSGRLYRPPKQAFQDSEKGTYYTQVVESDDMWAMGCITLQFLVWLLYGPAALDRFHKDLTPITRRFWEFNHDGYQVHHVAEEWMRHMAKDPICRAGQTALGDLLELIRDRLLVVDQPSSSASATTAPDLQNESSSRGLDIGDAVFNSAGTLQETADDPVVKMRPKAWNEHRDLITKLCMEENRNIQEVREIMRTAHNFDASIRSYRQHFDSWGFGKYDAKVGGQVPTSKRPQQSIKRPRAQAKEFSDSMSRILTRAMDENYWLPSDPLPPPDISSDNRLPSTLHVTPKEPEASDPGGRPISRK